MTPRFESSTSPTILLNDTLESYALQRGVARCFQATLAALDRAYGQHAVLCSSHRPPENYKGRYKRLVHFRGSRLIGINDLLVSLIALRQRPRLFYSPYYGLASVQAPQIFTVYDMIHERFPQYFSHNNRFVKRFINEKRRCFERATLLLAISSATARDILAIYPHLDPEKIVVTPLGVESSFFRTPSSNAQYLAPYFLYVGNRSLYKNFQRSLIAFGESGLAGTFALQVISPTGITFTAEEHAIIQRYKLQKYIHIVTDVDENALQEWYAGAIALIYPSEYEGFGLPIVEALASGTLVATSNRSSMVEVGGDVAEYFDPYSTESIAASLHRIVALSMEERQRRIIAGIAHARGYSWERYQERIVAAFDRCLTR